MLLLFVMEREVCKIMKLNEYNLYEDFDILAIWFREDEEIEVFCTINLILLFLNYLILLMGCLITKPNI